MERVIFRKQYNPYTKEWGFLAAFPDDDCNDGTISGVSFWFDANGRAMFENYGEIALPYYYNKKLIRRNTPDANLCRAAVEGFYNTRFMVCEKI